MLATGPALRVRWIGHSGRRIRNGDNIALALQSAPELTLHHDPADTLPNARPVFDRYRTIREIGSGGMATVYLADDLKHNRRVAGPDGRIRPRARPQLWRLRWPAALFGGR